MKKRKHSRIKVLFQRIFKVRYWADFDRIKDFSLYLRKALLRLFVPQKQHGGNSASFEQAVAQMKLSEADLQSRERALKRLSLFMMILAFLIFVYSFYHAIYGSWHAVLLCYSVALIAVALAFRYHFWYFQIKERKLGCTVSQWFREGLLGQKL